MDIAHLKERRRFSRLNERIFIFCRFMEEEDVDIIKGFANNVSAGGLMFEIERSIPPQTIFSLEIYQPLIQSKEEFISISASAKVKWATQIDSADKYGNSNKYRIGVEFVEIDDGERKTIAEYVQSELNT